MPGKSCGPCRASRRKDNPRQPAGRPDPCHRLGQAGTGSCRPGLESKLAAARPFPVGRPPQKGRQTDLPPLVMAESCILRLANA